VTGAEVRTVWRDRTVRAWLPELLACRGDLEISDATIRATERARQNILAADVHTPVEWEPLARLLLRAEGVASSFIEGVRASVPAVAAAQDDPDAVPGAAGWVAANLAVLDTALAHAHTSAPLTDADLHAWHAQLMAGHSALPPRLLGAYRDTVGWIGGTSPLDAALVPPPPDAMPELMHDLLGWLNRDDGALDPITQAAVAHAQFEVIHPYGDGNGRLGRVQVLWVLARRLGVRVLPPMSARIAADPGGYLAGLTLFRTAAADGWIRWFADVLTDASAAVGDTMSQLDRLQRTWTARLDAARIRSDAAARRLLPLLPVHPALTAAAAAELLGGSDRAARTALGQLAEHGIVAPIEFAGRTGPGRPRQWWTATEAIAFQQTLASSASA
jgi:Fic family protein